MSEEEDKKLPMNVWVLSDMDGEMEYYHNPYYHGTMSLVQVDPEENPGHIHIVLSTPKFEAQEYCLKLELQENYDPSYLPLSLRYRAMQFAEHILSEAYEQADAVLDELRDSAHKLDVNQN